MRVLGLDPGLERLGFGIVNSDPFEMQTMGVIPYVWDHTLGWHENINLGISNLVDQFPRVLMIYDPQVIGAEKVPPGKLGSRSETTAISITVCKTIAFQFGIPWTEYGANTIKKTVTGDDKATKAQVRNAILELFPEWKTKHKMEKLKQKDEGMKRPPGIAQDAFDGTAIAITHINKTNGEDTV